ncbi:MAG: aldehyde dehydrogenase [Rhodospirillales bacterium]
MRKYQIFIDGKWRDPASAKWLDAVNPYNGEIWAQVPQCNKKDVDFAVTAAKRAFTDGPWASFVASKRGALLSKAAVLLAERAERIADLESRDTGKRITETVPMITYIAEWFQYYGGLADKIEGRVTPMDRNDIFNYTLNEPLGVVAAITPWNSPVMIAVWKIAPALAAGNTVVVKPSEHASTSTLELMEVFRDAGFPDGVVNTVTGFGNEVGEPLVSHPNVAKVTFTGSETGGRSVNRAAADNVRPVTLELGGKSPQIVFADGDIESAVNGVISGVFLSNGQTCVAGSRLFLQSEIAEAFLDRLKDSLSGLRMGDPFDPETQIGPIATGPQFEKILSHIEGAKAEGANCVIGGNAVDGPECGQGWFVEPTVFTDVASEMTIAREEVFGPVLAVMTFDDEDEAVRLANDTIYGLAAGIWTRDLARAHRLARRIQSGTVYVNTYRAVSFVSPVGGYKMSGFGRENGIEAIREFMQTKSVWVNMADRMANPLATEPG